MIDFELSQGQTGSRSSFYGSPLVIALAILAFVLSAGAWVVLDQRIWLWDQAVYGDWTLHMWNARSGGMGAWIAAVRDLNAGQAPLLTWLGQLFIPIGLATGDIEPAMLMMNVLATGLALMVVYSTARRLQVNAIGCLAAVLLYGGSGLIFGMSTTYMTEALHALASAVVAFVALHAERRTLLKNLSLFGAAAAFSFLVKSSSIIFVAPMFVYMPVALAATANRRRLANPSDIWVAAGTAAVVAVTLWWYHASWHKVAMHFAGATTSTRWGRSVQIYEKMNFWSGHLLKALSAYPVIIAAAFSLVAVCLCVSLVQTAKKSSWRLFFGKLVENGTLYALALACMVAAILLAFSLQVNEDVRFLAPVIAPVAILIGWAISRVPWAKAQAAMLGVLFLNAILNHAYGFGVKPPFVAAPIWPFPVNTDESSKIALTDAVKKTCGPSTPERPTVNFVGASYFALNANSINYYARKLTLSGAGPCIFYHFSTETDPRKAADYMESLNPLYVVVADPTIPPPHGFENTIARPFAELMAGNQGYYKIPAAPQGMLIYQRVRP